MATAKNGEHQGDEFQAPDEGQEHEHEQGADVSLKLEDGTEIEIVDDTPAKDRGRKPLQKPVTDPTDEELDTYTAGVKQRIKELTHKRHDERRAREQVERERDEVAQAAQRLLEENRALRQQFASGAQAFGSVQKEAAESALAAAKAKLKKAHEDFDADAIADANAELATAALRVEHAKNFRAPPVQREEDDVQTRQAQQQRVEPDQKSLNWQARNQWFGTQGFEEYTSYALGLHQRLVSSGVNPKSDEYYAQIDARLKSKFPELFPDDEDDPADTAEIKPPAKKPPVVAPASRTPAGPGKVRLTQSQLAIAKRLGLTPQQYAAEVVKLQKEQD